MLIKNQTGKIILMAFHLYTSNKLDVLADFYTGLNLDAQLQDPFVPEIIVVQSQGMAAWLKQQLANRRGSAANIEFPFINHMIDMALESSEANLAYDPEEFTPGMLTWRIFKILLVLPDELQTLESYLRGGHRDLKQYQLAGKIAGLFDQYQIYRPDLMREWATTPYAESDNWQKFMWQLLTHNKVSRAERLLRFIDRGSNANLHNTQTISIFGVSTLPPLYLKCFEKLSRTIDVHFFYVNPCNGFWEDQLTVKEREQKGFDEMDELFCDLANPLLANLGRQGREFFTTMMGTTEIKYENDLFVDLERENLLTILQQDVLEMVSPNDAEQLTCAADDDSIQIHLCHNKTREIEILHDNLLNMIEQDNVQPRNILVMAPDIMAYAPYINAVFGDSKDRHGRNKIPYDVTDQSLISYSQIVSAFIELLNLAQARFTVNSIMDLLEIGQVHTAFGLQDKDLELIRKWLCDTRIHWGIDGKHREALGGIYFDEFSWRNGIKRMLLGFAINDPNNDIVVNNILPYDQIEGGNSIILGKFIEFVESLFALSSDLKNPRSIDAWSERLQRVIDQFFVSDNESYTDIGFLRYSIMQLQQCAQKCNLAAPLSIDIIRNYLSDASMKSTNSSSFLRGRVTFCTMQPMRSIPCKVICLIGMNDCEFPRSDMSIGFNIIARKMRLCDRSKRYEDRYLFLEALLSARQKLYISYQGRSEKDNSVLPAATPVCELLDYIKQRFSPQDMEKQLETAHKLQAFNPAYFCVNDDKLFSYSLENKDAAEVLQSPPEETPFFSTATADITSIDTLELEDLIRFFNNPSNYFMQYTLGAAVKEYNAEQLDDVEPFALDALDGYNVNQDIFSGIISGKAKETIYQTLKHKQKIEVGVPGKFTFAERYQEIEEFISKHDLKTKLDNCAAERFIIPCGNINITGRFEYINRDDHDQVSQYRIRYANAKGKDMISAWLYHLAATIYMDKRTGTFLHTKNNDESFNIISKDDAARYLEELLKVYREGLIRPLPFFCESSYVYATTMPKKSKASEYLSRDELIVQAKLAAARKTYNPGDYNFNPDGGDNAVVLCFGDNDKILCSDDFKELAMNVFYYCSVTDTIQRPLVGGVKNK
jgi:exodeoxyribonuclease V gamma subunit